MSEKRSENGYISLFLPIFVALVTIPVMVISYEFGYYFTIIKTREEARILAKSYGEAVTSWYLVGLSACKADLTCTQGTKEITAKAYIFGEEVFDKLQKEYQVVAFIESETLEDISFNKDIVFKVKAENKLPIFDVIQVGEYKVNIDDKTK